MTDQLDAGRMLEAAERAAIGGDLVSAEELLRRAASLQESELGPLHPDLANTLNNLAIVTEKAGRPSDAEAFYRRASAIASASLPADHPMVAASRQNLEDFCRARGLPIEAPPSVMAAARDTVPDTGAASSSETLGLAGVDGHRWNRPRGGDGPRVAPVVVARNTRARIGVRTRAAASRRACAIATSRAARRTGSDRAAAAADCRTASATIGPAAASSPPLTLSLWSLRSCASLLRRAATAGAAIRLATRCRRDRWFSTPVSGLHAMPRSYTAGIAETHCGRQQDSRLAPTQPRAIGTYSRQTVDSGEDWRVEVRSANGDLLHEQRFVVR